MLRGMATIRCRRRPSASPEPASPWLRERPSAESAASGRARALRLSPHPRASTGWTQYLSTIPMHWTKTGGGRMLPSRETHGAQPTP